MRRRHKISLLWAGLGAAGALLLALSMPHLHPLLPSGLALTRADAEAIARARLADLGEIDADAYVVTRLEPEPQLERRLQVLAPSFGRTVLRDSHLADMQVTWEFTAWPEGAQVGEWSHRALVTLEGLVMMLRYRTPAPEGNAPQAAVGGGDPPTRAPDDATAVRVASELLAAQGFDPAFFEPVPEIQRDEGTTRTVTRVRFRTREAILGADYPYGLEIFFEDSEVRGFAPWLDDPNRADLEDTLANRQLVDMVRTMATYLLLPLIAIPFLRRYHEGELGVRRGVHIFLVCNAAAVLWLVLNAGSVSSGTNFGFIPRQQTTWLIVAFAWVFQFLGLAVIGMMSWSLGEAKCRARWPQKLAALDAVFGWRWTNATVARSTLQGFGGGLLMAGILFAAGVVSQDHGAWPMATFTYDQGIDGPLPGLSALLLGQGMLVPLLLFTCLLLPAWSFGRLGTLGGLVVSTVGIATVIPIFTVLPLSAAWLLWLLVAPIPPILFRWGDALASLLAPLTAFVVFTVTPLLLSPVPGLETRGWLALLVVSAPLWVGLRHLGTDREFVYRWDDVPPHVRRIAERERQRVEIETARNIQSSILPELPPQLNGVELAHSYLPASEVGGDFYDVLALDDGRVAVAVGDVAGHGVASGLVMSMARSALAVQVTFDPAVEAVMRTLNRMVYQSARRRLLSTLLYAVVDPRERHLLYASAGHVFPYRIGSGGDVEELESVAYPLGVRRDLDVRVRSRHLAAGDTVFMFSDGLVEARPEGSEQPFGFERLEDSLRRHAQLPPRGLRDAVLADLRDFTGFGPQDDDLTVLVLRMPAA